MSEVTHLRRVNNGAGKFLFKKVKKQVVKFFSRTAVISLGALLACSLLMSSVDAGSVVVGTKIKMRNTPGAGDNGEFEVFTNSNAVYGDVGGTKPNSFFQGKEDFRTFCVEGGKDVEYFTPGKEYTVISMGLKTQSFKSPKDFPVLTLEAAALYREFARSQADGYTFNFFGDSLFSYGGTSRNTDANLLQNAIWYYLGSITIGSNVTQARLLNKYVDAMETHRSILSSLTIGSDNIGGVRIMNLVDSTKLATDSAYYAQDQLYFEEPPSPITGVPEPSSIVIFTLGVVGFAAKRRRK